MNYAHVEVLFLLKEHRASKQWLASLCEQETAGSGAVTATATAAAAAGAGAVECGT